MNKGPLANINFKTVVKAKDMDDDMFNQLEKWARETFESKEKFRDEMVKIKIKIGSCQLHKKTIRRKIQR